MPPRLAERLLGLGRRPFGPVLRVRARITAVLVASGIGVCLMFLLMRQNQNEQVNLLFDERVDATAQAFEHVLQLRASGAAAHASDYSRWDDMVEFVRTRDPEWARVNLLESSPTFELDAVWVYDADLRLVRTVDVGGRGGIPDWPVTREGLAHLVRDRSMGHCFARVPAGVLELWSAPIQPTADLERRTAPVGYFLIGRLWSPARLADLASSVSGEVRLQDHRPGDAHATGSHATGRIEIHRPLTGADGVPLAELCYVTHYPVAAGVRRALNGGLVILLAALVLSMLLTYVALTWWVWRPIADITASLAADDPDRLGPTLAQPDELGDMARLVDAFFAQRRELTQARETAERAVRARSLFFASVSHELRTPLHGILSFARFGIRDARAAGRAEIEDSFQNIQDCGTSLLAMLNDLLDLAKFEAGRMRLVGEELDLPELVHETAAEFTPLFTERALALAVDAPPAAPAVLADRTRLQQVLRNLLGNAARFAPGASTVRVALAFDGAEARLTVEDSGPGIPAAELENIFRTFEQASNAASRSGGTGLGLAICRQIVRAHGGRIRAENRAEGGARFVVELPLRPAQLAPAPPDADAAAA